MPKIIKLTLCFAFAVILLVASSYAVFLRRKPVLAGNGSSNTETQLAISLLESELKKIESNRSNKDYRTIIENDFNCRFYIYKEVDLPEGVDGQCLPMLRIIKIDNKAENFFYCSTFAHEMIHLTGYIQQESFVNFQTFLYLFEHDDPEFHNFGVLLGIYSLQGMYPREYDCNGNIINFVITKLNNKNSTV